MSYTLRGRIETRLAGLLPALVAAAVIGALLPAWWPLELAALMVGLGLTLDAVAYHRLLPYQAGWLALPLGLVELGILIVLVRDLGISAPLGGALAFFAGSWLLGQLLVHAVLPLGWISYAEDGGELGRAGAAAAIGVTVVLGAAGGFAWSTRPPVVHLSAGEHKGPIVLDHRQRLVGDKDAIVRGGIVVTADDVTISGVTVIGGENGIDVENAKNVVLKNVTVVNARMDGIHVRRSQVRIENCRILSPPAPFTQGIDISYAFDLKESVVMGCTVEGGAEGIVTHFSNATLMGNKVSRTSLRGIDMTEMSMGMIEDNQVTDAIGIGIFCGDHSECMVDENAVVDTRPDLASGDLSRAGYGIVSHYGAITELGDGNTLVGNAKGISTFVDGRFVHSK